MEALIGGVALVAVAGIGLGVVIGKLSPQDALARLGLFVLIICLTPALVACLTAALIALKPLLILLAVLAVVTVIVKALLTMKS